MVVRNLLVPTDFSDESLISLQYALALARDIGASVHVIHSYYIPVATIDADYVADQALWLEQARLRAQEDMQQLELAHLQQSGVPYSCMVHPGPAMGDINEAIKEHNIDLVVMGTYDTGQLSGFFGDFYAYVVRHAKAPALLVPLNSSYSYPANVVFATDLKPYESAIPLQFACSLLLDLNSRITILHVYKAGEAPDKKKQRELNGLTEIFSDCSVQTVLVQASDTEEAVLEFANNQQAHWLLAVTHRHGFLDKLFHSSHTKKFARTTDLPLLVLHDK